MSFAFRTRCQRLCGAVARPARPLEMMGLGTVIGGFGFLISRGLNWCVCVYVCVCACVFVCASVQCVCGRGVGGGVATSPNDNNNRQHKPLMELWLMRLPETAESYSGRRS